MHSTITKLIIHRSTDAFLYLPTYIAEQLGIFETLLGKNVEVVFENSKGDDNAINNMLRFNNESVLSIAIADPTVFLGPRFLHEKKEDIQVIGAIIDKLPFWAIDHIADKEFNSTADFKEKFKSIIHCKSKYATGAFIGNRVRNETGIVAGRDDVEFGEEILELTTNKYENPVAITADIVSVAQAEKQQDMHINYRFSKEGKYITTGVLTEKKCCENNKEILNKVIESIQKSISILYCSSKTAKNICSQLNETKTKNIKSEEIERIIELILDEKFYPADLNITKEGWDKGAKALAKAQHWEDDCTKDMLNNSFKKYVNNEFVLNSERSIAKQFGIDVVTFDEEIKDLKNKNIQLNEDNKILKEKLDNLNCLKCLKKLLKRILNFIKKPIVNLIIITLLPLIGVFIINNYCLNSPYLKERELLTTELAILFGIPTLYGLIRTLKNEIAKKKNEDESNQN